jgi:CRISPR-associated protein Cmr4
MPTEIGVYLLTSTHVGAGSAAGAIDLPIARERHTGHPLLPASGLKGVLRRVPGLAEPAVRALFGPPPPQKGQKDSDRLIPGDATFTDGLLLAFPVRCLSHGFVWVTCPQVIARWRRLREAHGLTAPEVHISADRPTATFGHAGALVVEDLAISTAGFGTAGSEPLQTVAKAWSRLLPRGDGLAVTLPERLVCLPDADFGHLVRHTTPVTARVQLTPGKTTDKYVDEQQNEFEGNLWYEETLPPDCLFSFVLGERKAGAEVRALLDALAARPVLQIGANETVGQGLSRWTAEGGA